MSELNSDTSSIFSTFHVTPSNILKILYQICQNFMCKNSAWSGIYLQPWLDIVGPSFVLEKMVRTMIYFLCCENSSQRFLIEIQGNTTLNPVRMMYQYFSIVNNESWWADCCTFLLHFTPLRTVVKYSWITGMKIGSKSHANGNRTFDRSTSLSWISMSLKAFFKKHMRDWSFCQSIF